MSYISHMLSCENCGAEHEVMLTAGTPAQSDPNKSNPCPAEPAGWEPSECVECGHPLEVENAEELIEDYRIGAEEDHLEAQAEMRKEQND